MICCDSFNQNPHINYTYHHEALSHFSWLDHFFISSDLANKLDGFNIIDDGSNLSDHCPITLSISIAHNYVSDTSSNTNNVNNPARFPTMRWDKANLNQYYFLSGINLQNITPPNCISSSSRCDHPEHREMINTYCTQIIGALKDADHCAVPRILPKSLKTFWNLELDKLKNISIDLHCLWRTIGSPRHNSIINTERIKAKLLYKNGIKKAKFNSQNQVSDSLDTYLESKDSSSFWKCWNSAHNNPNKNNSALINNHYNHSEIANDFSKYFDSTFTPSNSDINATSEFYKLYHSHQTTTQPITIDISDVEKALYQLKTSKSPDLDGLTGEHFLNCHPSIFTHLKILFGFILKCSFVPNCFTSGLIIPIIKDNKGDRTSINNYRPITISSTISKIFEYILLDFLKPYLNSDPLQFGYKPFIGCSNAIFTLRKVIQYFNENHSNVYLASVDATKAFDRVNHHKLFTILIKKGIPSCFVNILVNWYSRLNAKVKWQDSFSNTFSVCSGVRQGGILSGPLFNIYIDNILVALRAKGLGCHLKNLFCAALMYADDLIILSASVVDLQTMLNVCNSAGQELSINFNPLKSKCMIIGPHLLIEVADLTLGDLKLPWVKKIDYLGITLLSQKSFSVDLTPLRKKFFTATNTILSKCANYSDMSKLFLLESHCLPILLYASESLNLPYHQITELNSYWNSVYRKFFLYNRWESVRSLISFSGRLDLPHLLNLRSLNFIIKLQYGHQLDDDMNSFLIKNYFNKSEYVSLFSKYGCGNIHNVNLIKKTIFSDFHSSF